MAKPTGLIFSLFDVASVGHIPFGIPHYVQCILCGLSSILLCIPFIFADSERGVNLEVAHVMASFVMEIFSIFIVATLIAEVLFEQS